MNDYTRKNMRNRKRRIERRLGDRHWTDQVEPMFSASNIQYEMGERTRGTSVGGIGTMQLVARRTGLIEAIDKGVHVFEAAPAVSRVGSRAEHRLQRLERRNVPGRHRTAAQRCGVSGCAGSATDSGSDDGGRLLPEIRGRRRGVSDGGNQSSPARSLATATGGVFSKKRCWTRTGHWPKPRGNASKGWTWPTTGRGDITR